MMAATSRASLPIRVIARAMTGRGALPRVCGVRAR